MTKQEFIRAIALAVQKIAPEFGIAVYSPIIAQACLESAYGTSNKAKYNNFFGLKYRDGRVSCHKGTFTDNGAEQSKDGSYESIVDAWYSFNTLEDGVRGYFEFINISRYSNLKGVVNPRTYLELIKADGYATSLKYVDNVYNVIISNNLTQYDTVQTTTPFTNSSLISHINISPNKTANRNHDIDTITIHCVVGQVTVERLGEIFANPTRKASSNYGIGKDGRVGMYVEEKDRSWCSSNASNDHRAITIEVASDTTHPYAVTGVAYESLIKLVADICNRNKIRELVWSENKDDRVNHRNGCNMTVHRDYAAKSCPGEYLYSRHKDIANRVNELLGVAPLPTPKPSPLPDIMYYVQAGAYKTLEKALDKVAELKSLGFNAILKSKDNMYKVQCGAYKNEVNAKKRVDELKAKGVGAFITNDIGVAVDLNRKSVDEIARLVIKGVYGNGVARRQKLEAEGYNYDEVQKRVKELLK